MARGREEEGGREKEDDRRRTPASRPFLAKFRVELIWLTDEEGRPRSLSDCTPSVFHIEAEDPAEAVRKFVERDGAELIGDASRIRGYGSIGTARKGVRVYALEAFLANGE